MRERIVEMKNISFEYFSGNPALQDISLYVEKGESVALVGPNGGGKSTLLMVMAALLPATKGELRLFGRKITRKMVERTEPLLDVRKRVGMIFQDPDTQLFSSTVMEDIMFGPLNFGWDHASAERAAIRTMKALGISHLAERHPYELSGGEKRKAAIATVMVYSPDMVIMDEPTSDLDPSSREDLIRMVAALKKQRKTIVLSTHDMDMALRLADRVYVLKRKIIGKGPAENILSDRKLMEKAGLEVPVRLMLARALGLTDPASQDIEDMVRIFSERMRDNRT